MMTETERPSADEYNGWKNRETWAASLHLSNDFGLYTMVNGWAVDARDQATEDADVDQFGWYAEGVVTVEWTTLAYLMEKLRDYIDTLRADMQTAPDEVSETERMMVLEIGSEWRVDWRDVASAWLEDFDFGDAER